MSDKCVNSEKPLSFERLGQVRYNFWDLKDKSYYYYYYFKTKGYGFILYSTILDDADIDQKVLSIPGIRDRAYIQTGSVSLGVLYRLGQTSLKINLKNNKDKQLHIIVENMGRLNFGADVYDSKVNKKILIVTGKPRFLYSSLAKFELNNL